VALGRSRTSVSVTSVTFFRMLCALLSLFYFAITLSGNILVILHFCTPALAIVCGVETV
jgi:hypothetical protein